MGYIHDTHMSQVIPPTLFHCVTGTWSIAAGQVAGTIVKRVNDANQTGIVNVPIILPSNSVAGKGSKLVSIEVDYEITVAAVVVTATLNKVARGADTAVAVVSAPAFTYDAGHDTAAERDDVDQHLMTITLDEPVYLDNDEYYLLELSCDQAGDGGLIEFLGAVANYTLRL
jgi:hypothetical protein